MFIQSIKCFSYFLTLFIILSSCTNLNNKNEVRNNIPEIIYIAIHIDEYKIIDYRLLTDITPLKGIKYAGRYRHGNTLYFKLEPIPIDDYFWLAEVPGFKSGSHKLTAKRITNPQRFSFANKQILPESIKIYVEIKNRRIQSQRIENFGSGTLGLYFSESYRTNSGKVGVIRSDIYKDEKWKFLFPTENGIFTLIAEKE